MQLGWGWPGYTIGQLNADTEGLPNHGSKLLKIIRQKAAEIGRGRARQLLLEVCKRLPYPVVAWRCHGGTPERRS